jgi:hypothetical protein
MKVTAGLKTDRRHTNGASNFFVVQVWRSARYAEMGLFCYFYGDPILFLSPIMISGRGITAF